MSIVSMPRGHESTVPHTFGSTDNRCPKCGNNQLVNLFCLPGQGELPKLSLCELDGEHLHRVCASCRYSWIERPMDQAFLNQQKGEFRVEGLLAAALAVIVERTEGATLDMQLVDSRRGWQLKFQQDHERRLFIVTVEPPKPEPGGVVPTPQEVQQHLESPIVT